MCGILGARRSWLRTRAAFDRGVDALRWRGPDGCAIVEAGDWWVGVARLAITDPAAPQPIHCPRTGRVAVFNGAVTSSAREWREHGTRAATRNDAELALLRLERGGPAALAATCGGYALAVLEPASDTVWLARDPEGEKPLWAVSHGGALVAFGSSVSALRVLGIDLALSEVELARLLRYGFCTGPSLASADAVLHADLRGVHEAVARRPLRRVVAAAPPEARSPADLRTRVRRAAARCARTEVPIGLCLSGGVDSSCLAAALRDRANDDGGDELRAYQFKAVGADAAERARAVAVARATGATLVPVDGGVEVLDALPRLTALTGLPQGDPSVLAMHATARAAHADGVRVLLSGEGADDQWLGYRRHRAAAWLPRRGMRRAPAAQLATGTAARVSRALAAPSPYDALLEVTPPAFARAALAVPSWDAGRLPLPSRLPPALDRARHVDRAFYLRFDLLPKCDTATMAAGVEARCPYLDPEVLASPETGTRRARAVLGKVALKRAFAGALPAGILEQRKRGFGLPLDRWLRTAGGSLITDVLRDARTRQRPHVRAVGLDRMLDLHRAGRARLGHALYLVAAVEFYMRVREGSC